MKPRISKKSNKMLRCSSSCHKMIGSGRRITIWSKISEIWLLTLTRSQRRQPLLSKYLILNSHNHKHLHPFWLCHPLNLITKWQVQKLREPRITLLLKLFWDLPQHSRLTVQWTWSLRAVLEAHQEMTPQAPIETESAIFHQTSSKQCQPLRQTSATRTPPAKCISSRESSRTWSPSHPRSSTPWCSR